MSEQPQPKQSADERMKELIREMDERAKARQDRLALFWISRVAWLIPSLLLGGRFIRSIVAFPLCLFVGWLMTWFTYGGVDWVFPLPTAGWIEQQLDVAAADVVKACEQRKESGLECTLVPNAIRGRKELTFLRAVKNLDPAKPPEKVVVARFVMEHVPASATYPTANDELRKREASAIRENSERIELTLWGGSGSNESIGTIPIVLYKRVPALRVLFFTSTVTTPASVHAFERASIAFAEALKDKATANDYSEEQGEAIQQFTAGAINRHFGSFIQDVTWTRRLNGPIQASTVVAFWALMIQLASRLAMNYCLEMRIRSSALLHFLWSDTDDLGLRKRMVIDGHELERLVADLESLNERVRRATWHESAYLELYVAAAAAYLTSSGYTDVPAFVESRAGEILDSRAASQGFLRFLIWSIPTIGFIGTVVGIGDALSQTVNVDSIDRAVAAVAKSEVSGSIGVAFDTTLVALVLSLIGMLTFHIVSQLEELIILGAKAEAQVQFIRPRRVSTASDLTRSLIYEIRRFREWTNEVPKVIGQFRQLISTLRQSGQIGPPQKQESHTGLVLLILALLIIAAAAGVVWYLVSIGKLSLG